MKKNDTTSSGSQKPEQDPGFRNVAMWLLLIAILTGAWFLLDWLMNAK